MYSYSAATVAKIKLVQLGFSYLALMQFTEYLYPKSAIVYDDDTFDFIIVGAGTAGSVIANRLTENRKMSVLLIEAGGDPPIESNWPATMIYLKKSNYDWNFTANYDENISKCHQNPYVEISAGKMLGGTSSLNYMIYSRGHSSDYNIWAKITNDSTWNWENVYPYFLKIETNCRMVRDENESTNNILNSFKGLGHDILNDPVEFLGYSKELLSLANDKRTSSASAYLTPIKDRKNLHVLKNTLVTKINFDKFNTAVGVNFIDQEGKIVTVNARREVIVSAGAFNTPKLLMLSGIGPKEHLSSKKIDVISDLPVGRNLQDHVSVTIPYAMEKSEHIPINPGKYISSPMIGYTALNKNQKYPDFETHSFLGNADLILFYCAFGYRLGYEYCDNAYSQIKGKTGLYNEIIHLNPKSRGYVKLRSCDPMEKPEINLGYLSHEDDLEDLVQYIQHFIPIINTTHFREVEAELVDPTLGKYSKPHEGSDQYWRSYASCLFNGQNYFSGTCAMGDVVDSRLRVYGVKRLRVADASVMPTLTRGDINGPVTMIGEKAADFIKEDNHY